MPVSTNKLQKEAKEIFIGGVNSPVRAFKDVGGEPLFIESGSGAYIKTLEGQQLIDYVLAYGPILLGHGHPSVVEALKRGVEKGLSFGAPTQPEVELGGLIRDFVPSCEKVRLMNSGTEATITAVRLSRGFTGRKKIVKFNGCYHGHNESLMVKAGQKNFDYGVPSSKGVLEELTSHTLTIDYNDLAAVEAAFQKHGSEIAAVILEPVCGNIGVVLPKQGFLQGLRDICTTYGALLIFDEVMTGFRVSLQGAQGLYNIVPDLTCLGKVIGGGLPCGAVGGKKEIMDFLSPQGPVFQAGTFNGNFITATAGKAALQFLKSTPESFTHAEIMTKKLVQGFNEIIVRKGVPVVVNSIGTMFTPFFNKGPIHSLKDVLKSDLNHYKKVFHFLINKNIYFAPSQYEANFMSIAHQPSDIDVTLSAFDEALNQIEEG